MNEGTPSAAAAGQTASELQTSAMLPSEIAAGSASSTPIVNPRSCITCRKRKVRCDKTTPCANCRRAQSTCVYPAPGRFRRHPQLEHSNAVPRPSASNRETELLKRLRKLEDVVDELSSQVAAGNGDDKEPGAAESTSSISTGATHHGCVGSKAIDSNSPGAPQGIAVIREAAEEARRRTQSGDVSGIDKRLGRLVLHDGGRSSRYINSGFWSKLNDEINNVRVEMEAVSEAFNESGDNEDLDQSPKDDFTASSDHHSFLFGYRSADVDLTALHPLPSQGRFLWQVYLENVEPLLKLMHIPTMDKLILGMESHAENLTAGDEALLFAIYYAAVNSMGEGEVQTNFGVSQAQYVSQFRFALEQALARANLLNTSDIAVLQAFTLFLTMVKCHDDSKFCWTLTGICVRMAQALGLHRDGVQLGLPPFEVEMRRRLWWGIMNIDLRSAEEMGSDLIVSDKNFDTQLPSNINDADIDPSFTEFPLPQDGRTDTTVSLVRSEICALSRRLFTAMTELGPIGHEDIKRSLEEREHMLVEVYDRIEEKFLKHAVTTNDPLYWMAALVARIVMAKMGLIIYQPVLFPGTGPELSKEIRNRLWLSTIEIVEHNYILNTDPRCRQWRWLFQSYRQWAAIAYMLLEVSRRPWTATSERAWEAAQILGHDHPLKSTENADHTAVWIPVKGLYAKAKRHRATEIARLRADPTAAQRLDFEDELNALPERLSPIPGMESRKLELKLRWRKLWQAESTTSKVPYQVSIIPDPKQSVTARAQVGETHTIPLQSHSSTEQGLNLTNSTMTAQALLSGHSLPFIWQEGSHNSYITTQGSSDHSSGIYDAAQGASVFSGDFPCLLEDLDMDTDILDIGDIDWQHWNESLKALDTSASGKPPSGTGRWGGM
ncbi:hypothetical protein G7046_g573 [Stylonectria norvegica]|nr:hypothetical protein G7046_g573 [Stylonectria norvegica]